MYTGYKQYVLGSTMKRITQNLGWSFIFLFICTFSGHLYSAPNISEVKFVKNSNGDPIIEIHGTDFKSGPEVILYANFSNGQDKQLIPIDDPHIGTWQRQGASYMAYLNGEMGMASNGAEPGQPAISTIQRFAFPRADMDVFISYSIYMPENTTFPAESILGQFSDSSSWKMSWLMDGEDGYKIREQSDICLPTHVGHNGIFYLAGNDGNLVTKMVRGPDWWDFNSTNYISSYLSPNKDFPDTENGEIYFQSTNKAKGLITELFTDRPAGLPGTQSQYSQANFPGWFRLEGSENFQAIYDNIYVAIGPNIKARLEITDNADYSASTKIMTIPFESWQARKIVINQNTTPLPSLDGMYIHVTDHTGVLSSEGLSICANCPKAPLLQ